MVNKILILMTAMMMGASARAELAPVRLYEPDMSRGHNVMKAFELRRSEREFADRELSLRDLSDLMWAAYGINRPDGKHTAASAMNKQDVDVYVLTAKGAYLYVPAENELKPVAEGDHRALILGGQKDFPLPPVTLVMVSDPSRFGIGDDRLAERMGAIDAGLVSQNVALFCSGTGLVTVPRVSMDADGLRKLFGLTGSEIIVINNPVGYPARE